MYFLQNIFFKFKSIKWLTSIEHIPVKA